MKKIILLFLLYSPLLGQTEKIDSLKIVLEEERSIVAKISILNQLSFEYQYVDADTAIKYANSALEFSNEISDSHLVVESKFQLASSLIIKKNYDTALHEIEKALTISKNSNYYSAKLKLHRILGKVYLKKGKHDKAIEILKSLLSDAEKNSHLEEVSYANNLLGLIYTRFNEHKKSLSYYLKAYEGFKKTKNIRCLGIVAHNLGRVYRKFDNYDKALYYLEEALRIGRIHNNKYILASGLNNVGNIYENMGEYQKAEEYFLKALKVNNEMGNTDNVTLILLNLGIVTEKQKKNKEAINYYKSAEEYLLNTKSSYVKTKAYEGLSDIYKNLGYYEKALKFYELFKAESDTLFSEKEKQSILEIEKKYETEKLRADNILLKKDNEINQNNFFYQKLLFVLVLIILVLLIFYTIVLRKNDKKMKRINSELEEINMTKDKFFSIIAHDLKNPFIALLGYSDLLEAEYDELKDNERREFISGIKIASNATYKLLENLLNWARSQSGKIEIKIEQFYLLEIVDNSITVFENNLKQKNIKLKKNINPNLVIKTDRMMVQTIITNLLGNSIKFTNFNGNIEVNYTEEENYHLINVSDSGIGISEEDQKQLFKITKRKSTLGTNKEGGTGLGLIVCKEFAEKLGGDIKVKSEIGKGSTFTIVIPK